MRPQTPPRAPGYTPGTSSSASSVLTTPVEEEGPRVAFHAVLAPRVLVGIRPPPPSPRRCRCAPCPSLAPPALPWRAPPPPPWDSLRPLPPDMARDRSPERLLPRGLRSRSRSCSGTPPAPWLRPRWPCPLPSPLPAGTPSGAPGVLIPEPLAAPSPRPSRPRPCPGSPRPRPAPACPWGVFQCLLLLRKEGLAGGQSEGRCCRACSLQFTDSPEFTESRGEDCAGADLSETCALGTVQPGWWGAGLG